MLVLPVGVAIRAAFVIVEGIGFVANLPCIRSVTSSVMDATLGPEDPWEYQGSTTPPLD